MIHEGEVGVRPVSNLGRAGVLVALLGQALIPSLLHSPPPAPDFVFSHLHIRAAAVPKPEVRKIRTTS